MQVYLNQSSNRVSQTLQQVKFLQISLTGEGEAALLSGKRRDCQSRDNVIKSVVPRHDAQMTGPYLGLSPVRLSALDAKSEVVVVVILFYIDYLHKSNLTIHKCTK